VAPAAAAPSSAALRNCDHAAAVPRQHLLQLHQPEGQDTVADPRADEVRRDRQLQGDLQRLLLSPGGVDEREDDRARGRPVARVRDAVRDPPRPEVRRSGVRADAADHAVPPHAGRCGDDLEAADVLVALRDPGQGAELPRSELGGVDLRSPARVDRHRARLAVDAVHDADHARGAAEPALGHHRGRGSRRRQSVRDLQAADVAAPASVPGVGCPARLDLHRAGVRRHRRDDRRRARLDEHPVLRLPGVDRRRIPLRLGVRVRDRRGRLLDRCRDVRAACSRVVPARSGSGSPPG